MTTAREWRYTRYTRYARLCVRNVDLTILRRI